MKKTFFPGDLPCNLTLRTFRGWGWEVGNYQKTPCRYEEDDGQEKQQAGVLSNPPNPTAEAKVNAPQHDIAWYDVSYSIYDVIETLNSKPHSDQPCNHSPSMHFDDLVVMTFRYWCSAAKLGERSPHLVWSVMIPFGYSCNTCSLLEVYLNKNLALSLDTIIRYDML